MDANEAAHPVLEAEWLEDLVSSWPVHRMSPGRDPDLVVTRHRPSGSRDVEFHVRRGSAPSVVQEPTADGVAELVSDWRRSRGRLRRVGVRGTERLPFEAGTPGLLAEQAGGASSVTLDVDGFFVTVEAVDHGLARAVATAPVGIGTPASVERVLEVLGRWDGYQGGVHAGTCARVVTGHFVVFDRWFEADDDIDIDVLGEVAAVGEDRAVFGRAMELAQWPRWARPTLRRDLFAGVPSHWWDSPAVGELPASDDPARSTLPSFAGLDPDDLDDSDGGHLRAGDLLVDRLDRRWHAVRTPGPPSLPRSGSRRSRGPAGPAGAASPVDPERLPGPPVPGLHSWAWRVARAELERLVATPERRGSMSAVEVLERASALLAAGPSALPGLGEALLAARPGDADAVRRYVRSVMGPDGPAPEGTEVLR